VKSSSFKDAYINKKWKYQALIAEDMQNTAYAASLWLAGYALCASSIGGLLVCLGEILLCLG
jgi:hypothetical protein